MNKIHSPMDLEQLTRKLQLEDKRKTIIVGRFKYMVWAMLALLSIVFILDAIIVGVDIDAISTVLIIMAYVCFAYLFTSYHKEFKNIDYSVSTLEMLQKAALRYQLFHQKTIFVLLALLFLDASMALRFMRLEHLADFSWVEFVNWHAVVVPFWLIAVGIGVGIWYVRQKPLRDSALLLIDELQS